MPEVYQHKHCLPRPRPDGYSTPGAPSFFLASAYAARMESLGLIDFKANALGAARPATPMNKPNTKSR
jgi:hypothetical protein